MGAGTAAMVLVDGRVPRAQMPARGQRAVKHSTVALAIRGIISARRATMAEQAHYEGGG